MDIVLNVQPDVLISKAGDITKEKNYILDLMDQAKSEITSLSDIWIGGASDEYRSRFMQVYDDIDNILAIITGYVDDLNEAANIYSRVENTAKAAAEALPVDGVFRF